MKRYSMKLFHMAGASSPQPAPSFVPLEPLVEVVEASDTTTVFVYYRLFQRGMPLDPFYPSSPLSASRGHDNNARLGRVRPEHIAPPRTAKNLKAHIATVEGLTASDIEEIFFPNADVPMAEEERLNFSADAVGTDPAAPIEVIVRDKAYRSVSDSASFIFDPAIWTFDANGVPTPKVEPKNPYHLAISASPPCPWKRAHVKGKEKSAWIDRTAKDSQYQAFSVREFSLFWVNKSSTTIIKNVKGNISHGKHYEVVIVADMVVGFMHVDDVEFEGA
ncbi:hypothetical protein DL93DRAFT_1973805 [Clavulina sp. PMI_390]|nr:hypothetical protein DL93DRAFT_1973805 [Clavulina sp. PMI_390]